MKRVHDSSDVSVAEIRSLLGEVNDPEVPVLSILDLGIVRDIRAEGGMVEVIITPTYSGCPAMDMIRMEIRAVLGQHGYEDVRVTTVLSPAWTTEWMSQEG